MERLRLFVAVSVPGPLLARLEERTRELRAAWPSARWIPRENQHVTLKFLGPVEAPVLAPVKETVRAVAEDHAPAYLTPSFPGVFPSRTRARVLWVGLDDPDDLLAALAADLDTALAPLGFNAEKRPFRAHLTLARFRDPVRVKDDVLGIDLRDFEDFRVSSIELFRSHLHPKGARYEVIESFALGKPPRAGQ
ncbi:MAG: RNA 2',3'-cyclic phosphodiesterase [Actinomycetota bacterium]|nr:RNA 2',3'-cyclic phosphodiesterase [Actinomycetota bacterium]